MTTESLLLAGPAGRIECFIKLPPAGPSGPAAAAVVCHPHPLFGGTMHNKVVHAASAALANAGLPVMRFNFRGAGLSEGRHDGGRGEQDDLRVVLDHLAQRYPALPLLVAGYSFGAFVGLRAGTADPRVLAMIGIGVPVSLYDFSFLAACEAPLALIQGDGDPFGPLPLLLSLSAALPRGAKVLPVAGARHNFAGHFDELARRVHDAIPPRFRDVPVRPATPAP